MASRTVQFYVVAADSTSPNQAVGRIALFNEDGTPWQPGGDGPVTVAWGDVTGKPSTFTPASHTHTIAQVDGLQTILTDYENRIADLENPA